MDFKKEISKFWNAPNLDEEFANLLDTDRLLDFEEQIKLNHFNLAHSKSEENKKISLSPLLPVKFDDLFFLPVDFDLKEIFNSNCNIFLVGAGISRNSPSNVPTANEIVKIFLDSIIPDNLKEFFNNTTVIRYDVLFYIIKKYTALSNDIFRFFSEFKKPNMIHYFLAKALIKGALVLTTNYDNLIERALYTLLPKSSHDKLVVISKIENNLSGWQEIKKLREEGKIILIKLHGTYEDISSEANLSETIVADTGRILKDRPFEIIENDRGVILDILESIIDSESSVITMGYSGGDVLDIAHALTNLSFKKLIWLEHNPEMLSRKKRLKSNSILKFGAQNYLDRIIKYKGLYLKYIGFSFQNYHTIDHLNFHLNYVDRIFTNRTAPKQEKIKIICHTTDFVEKGLGSIFFGENFSEEMNNLITPTKSTYNLKDFASKKFINITEDTKLLIAVNLASQMFKPDILKKISETIFLEYFQNNDLMKKERSEFTLEVLLPMVRSLIHYRFIEEAEKLLRYLIADPMEFMNKNPQPNENNLLILAQYSSFFHIKNEFKKCIKIFNYLFKNINKSNSTQCVQLFHDFFLMDEIYSKLSKHELIDDMNYGISPFPTMFDGINDMDTMIKAQYIQSAYQMRRGRFDGPMSAEVYAYNLLDIITGFGMEARYIYVYDIFIESILQNDSNRLHEYAPILLFDVLEICKKKKILYWMNYFKEKANQILEKMEKYYSLNPEKSSAYTKLIIHDVKLILKFDLTE